jgi:hypothetical protein
MSDSKIRLAANQIAAFDEFVAEFGQETDRAAVLLGGAKLDDVLLRILAQFLIPNATSRDEFLEAEGPLSTFSARINATYRLGIIDADFARSLHLVRKIRNDFAHEIAGAKLDWGKHRDRITALCSAIAKTDIFREVKRSYFDGKEGTRGDFLTCLVILVARLEGIYQKTQCLIVMKPYGIIPKSYDSKQAGKSVKK